MNDERYTDAYIEFDLRDSTAQSSAKINAGTTEVAPFCKSYNQNFSLYTNGPASHVFTDYMSNELNYNVLDGSLSVASFNQASANSQDILLFAKNKLNTEPEEESCVFKIKMQNTTTCLGLMLYFIGDYPKSMHISWNKLAEGSEYYELSSIDVTLNSNVFTVIHLVKEFDFIEFTILDSWVPDRYTKMYYVQMGADSGWKDNELQSGTLVQEVNLLADKLSLNNLTFEVLDADNNFNYGNENNIMDYFPRLTPLYPKVYLDDVEVSLGKYYLDSLKSENNVAKFNCFSAIGILDTIPFNEGRYYNGGTNDTAGKVIRKIFEVAGITQYTINSSIDGYLLYGVLPPCSCREALQKILFVTGGVARTDSSTYQIMIDIPTFSLGSTVQRDEKITTNVTDMEYVTGVELSYSTYAESANSQTIVEQTTYSVGEHLVVFNQPCVYANVVLASGSQGVTVLARSTYYIKFKTAEGYPATLSITSKIYESKSNTVVANRTTLKTGAIENVKKYSTTLCNYGRAYDLVNDLLKYYIQSTLDIKIKQFSKDNLMMGRQLIQNEVSDLGDYVGRYTSRTFNLTGGFIDDAKLVGYYEYAADMDYYMDNFNANKTDIFSGDDILI